MLEASSDLPDNVAALQAMIALQNEKLSIFKAEIKERDYRIEKLEHQTGGLAPPSLRRAVRSPRSA